VLAWKWVDELLKHEARLSGWERQFLQCLRSRGKSDRNDLALTAAQWRCIESNPSPRGSAGVKKDEAITGGAVVATRAEGWSKNYQVRHLLRLP
jgi:hypothetical protein